MTLDWCNGSLILILSSRHLDLESVREELGADIMCDCAEGSGWHGPLQKVLNYAWNSRSSQILALFCSHCTTLARSSIMGPQACGARQSITATLWSFLIQLNTSREKLSHSINRLRATPPVAPSCRMLSQSSYSATHTTRRGGGSNPELPEAEMPTHRKRSGFACARSLAALDISTQFVLHRMT